MALEQQQPIDISKQPELSQLVDEPVRARRTGVLRRDNHPVAVLTPRTHAPRPARRRTDDSLVRLLAIADSGEARSTGPTDISSNKHAYLAQATKHEADPPEGQ